MTRSEAEYECRRWLAYLDTQKARSLALAQLATERRSGRSDAEDARRRMEIINRDVVVYDDARLAEAVRLLLTSD